MPTLDIATDRYYLDYEGPHGVHTLMFRFSGGELLQDATAEITGFINSIKGVVYNTITFNRLSRRLAGAAASFPVAWTAIPGTSPAVFAVETYPRFHSFVGRDQLGVRVRYTVFGMATGLGGDFRVLPAEDTAVSNALAYLQGAGRKFKTVANYPIIWNSYANAGLNAYHQRKRRTVS